MAERTDFPVKTSDFLAWFKAQSGTTFHDDIEIQDLRGKGAGRGIGKSSRCTHLISSPEKAVKAETTVPP